MSRRLLASYVGLAVLILILLEVPLALVGARDERGAAISQAQKVATGLAITANEDYEQGRLQDLQTVAQRYREATVGEVFVINGHGRVVLDSDDDGDDDAVGAATSVIQSAIHGTLTGTILNDESQPHVVAAAPVGDGSSQGAVLLSYSVAGTERRIHELWLALLAFAGIVLVGALVVGRWMTRTIARPLERLGATASTLDETNLGARADEHRGPAEIRALAHQFNQMANRLTELVRAQGRFVADASHQLRSPLTALRLRLENLEAEGPGAASPSGAVAAIDREVQRLSRLVDGLITLGHADAMSPERVDVDVDRIVEDRCEAWAALAQERRIHLHAPPGPDRRRSTALVPGDLDQILDNLLANALEVSPPGGTITVSVADRAGTGLAIHILDEGPGMTSDELERAFDRFWQGGRRSGSHGGLGLAIVRQLANRNELDVELAARPEGGLDASVRAMRVERQRVARQPSRA